MDLNTLLVSRALFVEAFGRLALDHGLAYVWCPGTLNARLLTPAALASFSLLGF